MGKVGINIDGSARYPERNRLLPILLAGLLFPDPFYAREPRPAAPPYRPVVGRTGPAVSFSGDVRLLPASRPETLQETPRFRTASTAGTLLRSPLALLDPVRREFSPTGAMPGPLLQFAGMDLAGYGSGFPPDPNGDVGSDHYVQAVNTSIAIFSKAGVQLAAFRYNDFFRNPTPTGTLCDSYNRGDPIVLYDSLAGRWIVSDFAWASTSGPFYECLAVSKTSDPVLGGWWKYAFLAHATLLNDYPKLSVWPDAYYLTADLFTYSSNEFQGNRVWALNRSEMLNGLPFSYISFDLASTRPTLLPSHQHGTAPPIGAPNYLVRLADSGILHLFRFHVDWTSPAAGSTLTGPVEISVAPWTERLALIPQKNSTTSLDALGDRLMMYNRYSRLGGVESLWLNHTVDSGGIAGIRWYQIQDPGGSAPGIRQQGTFQPDSNHRWIASMALDKDGNMAMGYSVSGASLFPSIRYAGRLAGDPLGELTQSETSLFEGTGPQSTLCGGRPCDRWGDYSSMNVDPIDGCTFWYTNEYFTEDSPGSWKTRIGTFRFPSCQPNPPPPNRYHFPFVYR